MVPLPPPFLPCVNLFGHPRTASRSLKHTLHVLDFYKLLVDTDNINTLNTMQKVQRFISHLLRCCEVPISYFLLAIHPLIFILWHSQIYFLRTKTLARLERISRWRFMDEKLLMWHKPVSADGDIVVVQFLHNIA